MKTLDELIADKIMDLLHYVLSKFIKPDITLEIKLDILSELNLKKAKSRNNSLKLFLENALELF